jgi:drug/metabolite transporter (DMT)-like permease
VTPGAAASIKPPARARSAALPLLVLLFSSSLWGLSWWPLKKFTEGGLQGPVLSMLVYAPVGLALAYFIWRERAAWRAQTGLLIALALVGGWANTSFVNALMLGDVVRVMFLFYLSPVWSVLGGWLFLGERVGLRRQLAVGVAVAGLWLVLGGSKALASALSVADVLALSAGLGFAANNVIARAGQSIPIRSKTAAVFLGCGVLSAAWVGVQGASLPAVSLPVALAVAAYGFGWLLLATATWQFGVTHLESGRAGVVMLAELLVAVLSATWWGGEQLTGMEWLGGALIGCAALIEATDSPSAHPHPEEMP